MPKGPKKRKPQGKISERLLLRELLAERPKKLKEIAPLVGSLATTDNTKENAVLQKVQGSTKLQLALAQARERGLEIGHEMLNNYQQQVRENKDVEKVTPKDRLYLLDKTINTINSLTRDSATDKQGALPKQVLNIEKMLVQIIDDKKEIKPPIDCTD